MNITEQELKQLENAPNGVEWAKTVDEIRAKRSGTYPPDWYAKVIIGNLKPPISHTTTKWYQMWVKHETADVVQMMKRCDPVLQGFNSLPCAPDGTPIREADGTVQVRSFNEMGFRMAKSYLKDQGFVIEREQENE